ncbi:MAG TPA: diguanylate cyclase [Aquifex sp.]|nr:diguanylate cyclase [Aquifex sp.]
MISFEELLKQKKKIYETAWNTFVFLIKNKIDPTPENYKLYYEKFFQQEKEIGNPIKGILKKANKVLEKSSNSLGEVVEDLKRLEESKTLRQWLDNLIGKLEKEKISLEELREEIVRIEYELEAINRDRYIDPLTGIWNRLALKEFLPNLPKLAMERNIVIAFLDLNKFKNINDTYGHLAGDKILKHFAYFIRSNLKRKDFLARYGGDEFIAVLFDIDLEDAKKLFEKLRKTIPPITIGNHQIKIDFCVGLTIPFGSDTPEEIIKRADEAMYFCKKTNKVEIKLK